MHRHGSAGRSTFADPVITRDAANPLWIGLVVLRLVTFAFAVIAVLVHHKGYARQNLGWTVLAVMAAWTAFVTWDYLKTARRDGLVVVVDTLLTGALMYTSVWILTPAQNAAVVPLITTVWGAGPPLAGGIRFGMTGGFLSGLAMSATTCLARGAINTDTVRDAVLLVGSGFVIGMASTTARRSNEQLRQALRAEAATAERERLARSIHDSVLQVLARVRRRGAEVGGEAGEIGKLAGEQEVALRSLVAAAPPESNSEGTADLRPRLQLLSTGRVQVSAPGTPVMLPVLAVVELTSLVREALSNVDKHAGDEARAWVLLEDLGDEVVISVRDDGVGMDPQRLIAAERQGRMGVARSIRGRVTDLGGTISLETAPGAGTEWEVRVPRVTPRQRSRWLPARRAPGRRRHEGGG